MPKIEHPERIKTLAMLKMEKNFMAVLDKGYPRRPYEQQSLSFWIGRIREETKELENEIVQAYDPNLDLIDRLKALNDARVECSNISNLVDYVLKFSLSFVSYCQEKHRGD